MNRLGALVLAAGLICGCTTETPPQELTLEDLPGTGWRLVSLEDDGGVMEALDAAEITLAFDHQGRVAGSGGCNRFFGGIETTAEGKLSLGPLGSTQMACEEDINDRELRFLRGLESCEITAGTRERLELHGEDGSVRLIFETAPDVAVEAS